MDVFLVVVAAAFGLIIGSFLNVVIHRLPRRENVARGRSRCPSCSKTISWYDNIPLVSWLALLGRCRSCKARIPVRYPLVEALTGGLFALAMVRVLALPEPEVADSPLWMAVGFAFMAAFLAALVAATFIDLAHTILPDEITKTGMWVTPICSLIFPWIVNAHFAAGSLGLQVANPHANGLIGSLLGLILGAGLIWGIAIVGKWIFRKDAMGFGDVKFMGMIGGFLGPVPVLMAMFIACLAGSVVGITIFVITRSRYMAFGPYLALGAAVMLLYGDTAFAVVRWWPRFIQGLMR